MSFELDWESNNNDQIYFSFCKLYKDGTPETRFVMDSYDFSEKMNREPPSLLKYEK